MSDVSMTGSGSGQPTSLPMTWPELGPRPHEFAAVFRLLSGEEKESLAADVVARGVRERIKMFEDKILDGRNRYLVLVEEGVFDPEIETWQDRPELFEVFEGTREEALEYVWSLNAERRHDTPAQRALAAERYANLRNITQAEAAQKFSVSERQVNSAAKVLEKGEPELVQAVEENRLPLYLAEQVADLGEEEQREVAEKPKREASAVAKELVRRTPAQRVADKYIPEGAERRVEPLAMTKFIAFTQSALRLAAGGETVGSEALIGIASECGIVEVQGGGFVYAASALVAMGTMIAALPKEQVVAKSALPDPPAIGDQVVFEVGGLAKGHSASFGVMHEDGHFSIRQDYSFPTRGASGGGYMWRYATFEDAIAACVQRMMRTLQGIVDDTGSLVGQKEKASAQAGLKWIGSRLADWRIVPADNRMPNVPVTEEPELELAGREAYDAALAALTEPRGRLHQATAKPALEAGLAAGVPVRQMAADLGHPLGTVQSWTARLGLTDPARNPVKEAAQ